MTEAGAIPLVTKHPDTRVLFVYDRHFSSFIERDWKLIQATYPNAELYRTGGPGAFFGLRGAVNRADLIFCWFGGKNALASAIWNRRRKPLVIVAGGYDVSCEPEWNYGSFARFPQTVIGRWVFARADRVLAVSKFAAASAREFARVDSDRLRLIYHGFDPNTWVAAPVARDLDVFTIIGQDPIRKNLEIMLEAAALLPERSFAMLGRLDTAAQARYDLKRYPNVRWHERLSDAELRDHYSRARVYLQPSRHEAFGCAVAEAMLMGCIPVVANATAQPEVVGDAGVLVESLTGEGVAAATEQALALPEEHRARVRSRIVQHFALPKYAGRLIEFIDEVLAERAHV